MQSGYVVLHTIVLLLIGVAGAGKTTFYHLLFDEPQPPVRKSTPMAQSSVRAVSLTRAMVGEKEGALFWERVSSKKLSFLVADGIKGFQAYGYLQQMTLEGGQLLQLLAEQDDVEEQLSDPGQETQNNTGDESHAERLENKKESSEINTRDELDDVSSQGKVDSKDDKSDPICLDIDQLFEMEHVKELLQLITSAEGSGEIFKREWLYLIDSGGQPQFHELLPTFVRHVSGAAFFVKLNESLESHPMVEYYNEEGALCGQPYESSHSHLQTLQNCLQAMQSRNDDDGVMQCPKLFFVGTHYDQEDEKEPLEAKNRQLLNILLQHDTFRKNLVCYSIGKFDQLLYPVNSLTPGQADKKVAADFRKDLITKCHSQERKIPIGWFVLEQLLQELSVNGILSFDTCVLAAGHLGMNVPQLKTALEYLAKLNIFEYFPKILPQVVFTTSQVLLNKVTELVEYSHDLNDGSSQGGDATDLDFREYGRFNAEMLKKSRFNSHYIDGVFEVEDLLNLWVELLVVAKSTDATFFMPAVLSVLPLEQLSEHRLEIHSSKMLPIAVHYPGGLFPSGIFSSLISHLQGKTGWKISTKRGKPVCLFKNCVKFSVSGSVTANVTLIYSHDWIELHVDVFDRDQKKACLVRDILISGLKHAEQVQKYNSLVPELAFFCPCESELHSPLHLASPVSPNNEFMRCRQDETVCMKLTDRHTLWLQSTDGKYAHLITFCVHNQC